MVDPAIIERELVKITGLEGGTVSLETTCPIILSVLISSDWSRLEVTTNANMLPVVKNPLPVFFDTKVKFEIGVKLAGKPPYYAYVIGFSQAFKEMSTSY
jgi:hypothetical protein